MNIFICIPHNYPAFDRQFLMSLFIMQQEFYEWCIKNKKNHTISLIVQGGYALDDMRNKLVKTALKFDATHLLWLDTDMHFPGDTIIKLIQDFEDNEEVEAVTGLYHHKHPPYVPQLYIYNDEIKKFNALLQFPLDSLFEVQGTGCGCLMVKAECFKRIKHPYFKFVIEEEVKQRKSTVGKSDIETLAPWGVGEDLHFFLKAKPLTLCNPTIQCKHYRYAGFGIDEYIAHNKLKRTKQGFKGFKKDWDRIEKEHSKRMNDD